MRSALRRAGLALVLAACAGAAAAAQELDVPTPYVPSTPLNVDEMLRLAAVGPGDVLYDLGSGDGRVVIAAARDYGARGVGVELDPKLVAESTERAQSTGIADRVSFVQADVLTVPVKEATVVTMYLLPPLVRQLQDRLYRELKPGARIVAHDYPFPDWHADRRVAISKTFYLYTAPARVAGTWKLASSAAGAPGGYELRFEQHYQDIKGAARVPGGILPAFEAHLAGERIAFVLVDGDFSFRYEGEVHGERMAGTVRWGYGPRQKEARWQAERTGGGDAK